MNERNGPVHWQAGSVAVAHIFPSERSARLGALDPKPRRGWPVYSNAGASKTANPVGVTCGRCKMVGPEKYLCKLLDWTCLRSPLRGLASVVRARFTINKPPPTGFRDSASGVEATSPLRGISNPQASSKAQWVMARAGSLSYATAGMLNCD
jgi:hypothetical protein